MLEAKERRLARPGLRGQSPPIHRVKRTLGVFRVVDEPSHTRILTCSSTVMINLRIHIEVVECGCHLKIVKG